MLKSQDVQLAPSPPPPFFHPGPGPHHQYYYPSQVVIQSATNDLLQFFSKELEIQVSRERDMMYRHYALEREKIYRDIQQEREALGREKAELERERQQMQRERMMRFELEKELREENEALRHSLVRLQATLDILQTRIA